MATLFPIKFGTSVLESRVPGHKGYCAPVWFNKIFLLNRLDGGKTGFFKNVKRIFPGVYVTFGKDFHGIVKAEPINIHMHGQYFVESTELN